MSRSIGLLVSSLALTATLAGCSQPVQSPAGPTTPQVSLSAVSGASANSEFDNAVAFVKTIYLDEYDESGQYVAGNTVAARYVTHQLAAAQVDSNDGNEQSVDPSDVDVSGDAAAGTVKIEDRSGDKTADYVWRNFQYLNGKIQSWDVDGKPSLDKRLWNSRASDESKGASANLVSAYEGNNGTVRIVVDLASKDRDIRVTDASYTAPGGYRQEDAASLSNDVDKGGKTLTYFDFPKTHVGGQLKLLVDRIDLNDESSSYSFTTLTLKVA